MGRVATRSRVRRVAGQMTTRRRQLLPLVVDDGCCIGCGACSVVSDGALTMQVTDDGLYEPRFAGSGAALSSDPDALDPALDAVCPFGSGADEDELSAEQFGAGPRHPAIGRHERIWAGSVADEGFRLAGTSGGMTTWIVAEALRTGAVDAVVHVRSHRDDDAGTFSRYAISTTVEELHGGRGSRYHVQTLEDVMAEVRRRPGRYAVVGVPCFIKAIRLLARADATIADRIGLGTNAHNWMVSCQNQKDEPAGAACNRADTADGDCQCSYKGPNWGPDYDDFLTTDIFDMVGEQGSVLKLVPGDVVKVVNWQIQDELTDLSHYPVRVNCNNEKFRDTDLVVVSVSQFDNDYSGTAAARPSR